MHMIIYLFLVCILFELQEGGKVWLTFDVVKFTQWISGLRMIFNLVL
jgi:hypothetical protein